MRGLILVILGVLGLGHFINWLLTKGVIWVVFELGQISWYDKFWVVYLGIFLIGCIFRSVSYNKK